MNTKTSTITTTASGTSSIPMATASTSSIPTTNFYTGTSISTNDFNTIKYKPCPITIKDIDYFLIHDDLSSLYNTYDNIIVNFKIEKFKIIERVPEKVYDFVFSDGTKIKTVCSEQDIFDLKYAAFLAIAKKMYKNVLTFEGILQKADELQTIKIYNSIVKEAIKTFKKEKREKEKQEEKEKEKKEQHKRFIKKKIAKKKKREENKQKELLKLMQIITKNKE